MNDYIEKKSTLNSFKEEMNKNISSLKNELLNEQIKNVDFKTKIESRLLDLQESTKKAGEVIEECNRQNNTNSESLEVLKTQSQQEINKISKIVKELSDYFNDDSNNFITEDLFRWISAFQDYLGTLTLEQTFCLAHLLAIFGIFICLFNLAFVFYAESLIRNYKLEIKFPKLAKFIRIRSKFQQYYFGWNLILIVTILAGLFYFNLKVFLL